jgi:hypothetical protein
MDILLKDMSGCPKKMVCFIMILSDYDCELPAVYERMFFLLGVEMRVYIWIPYCKCNAQVYTLYTLWMEKTMNMIISCGIARCVIACMPCMDTGFEMIEVKGDRKWASLWLWLC